MKSREDITKATAPDRPRAAGTLAALAVSTVALVPWGSALYLLYRLETGGVWAVEQPWRPVASVLIIAAGLALSFALRSYLVRRAPGGRRPT